MENLKVGDEVAFTPHLGGDHEIPMVVREVEGNKVTCDYYSKVAGEYKRYEFIKEQLTLLLF